MGAGKITEDKLLSAPNRIKPGSLGFSILSGARAGAGVYKATGGRAATGAIIGGAAAFASTFGRFWLGKECRKARNVTDPIVGAIEDDDARVIGSGIEVSNAA